VWSQRRLRFCAAGIPVTGPIWYHLLLEPVPTWVPVSGGTVNAVQVAPPSMLYSTASSVPLAGGDCLRIRYVSSRLFKPSVLISEITNSYVFSALLKLSNMLLPPDAVTIPPAAVLLEGLMLRTVVAVVPDMVRLSLSKPLFISCWF